MSNLANLWWRELVASLALLFTAHAFAIEPPSDANYVLITDRQNPELSRLIVFSSEPSRLPQEAPLKSESDAAQEAALNMTRSVAAAERVRGLTLLSGVDSVSALNAALVLLSDPTVIVRAEAFQLVLDHPHADLSAVTAIGRSDPSARIRALVSEYALEYAAERSAD